MIAADTLVLIATLATAAILLLRKVRTSDIWRATVTPLASIIGSGFLVLGPILAHAFGVWATLAMAGLCLAAWGFGVAIRDNIRHAEEPPGRDDVIVSRLSQLGDVALAGAYFVSVAYYLNLFGAFGVRLTPFDGAFEARMLTSAMLVALLVIGWFWGFWALERVEVITVTIKLAVIAGLLAGLGVNFGEAAAGGALVTPPPTLGPLAALTLGFGLIVTVQGFETSRYLGGEYPGSTRIRSMRLAQIIATVIYVVYVALLSFAFVMPEGRLSETAIIDLMGQVTPLLPAMLVLAALAAQASAAIADAGGAGGLVAEFSAQRVSPRVGYALLVAAALALTWGSDVFSIISHASRAFAFYYAVQSLIAFRLARLRGAWARAALYAVMTGIGLAAAFFGAPVEGG